MTMRLLEEMRPGQVLEIVRESGLVFVPISPRFEWHGVHLPMGTDGIIAEEAARRLAEAFDGGYFRTLPLALDEWRPKESKRQWGLDESADVFGMNFPTLPLESEYHESTDMERIVGGRLATIQRNGFRYAFLVNHHGGRGQGATLQRIAEKACGDGFQAETLLVPGCNRDALDDLPPPKNLYLKVGGHAGIGETHQLMAFRPDLVDLGELSEGELSVPETGILYREPTIPEEFNPHHASQEIADRWRESVLANLAERVRQVIAPRAQKRGHSTFLKK